MNAVEIAKGELIPMLDSLVTLLELAQEEEDLADGFMRLSTSAFPGDRCSSAGAILSERIQEAAMGLALGRSGHDRGLLAQSEICPLTIGDTSSRQAKPCSRSRAASTW